MAISDEALTDALAERIMKWKVTPDRFIKSGRTWLPKWRFSPLSCLDDAFHLLANSKSAYKLEHAGETFAAEVKIGGRVGRASGEPIARVITLALARAIGLEAER